MNYNLSLTHRFDKDVKLAKKRGLNIDELLHIVDLLVKDEPLPPSCRDHTLVGDYVGKRECHIQPDWLLIYSKEEEIKLITLIRTGTHSDLF